MSKVYLLDGNLICVGDWISRFEPNELGEMLDSNPLPKGAVEVDVALATTDKGTVVLASDFEALRHDAYPPIRDQLDALWKGGDAAEHMASLVQAVKDRYPVI